VSAGPVHVVFCQHESAQALDDRLKHPNSNIAADSMVADQPPKKCRRTKHYLASYLDLQAHSGLDKTQEPERCNRRKIEIKIFNESMLKMRHLYETITSHHTFMPGFGHACTEWRSSRAEKAACPSPRGCYIGRQMRCILKERILSSMGYIPFHYTLGLSGSISSAFYKAIIWCHFIALQACW